MAEREEEMDQKTVDSSDKRVYLWSIDRLGLKATTLGQKKTVLIWMAETPKDRI